MGHPRVGKRRERQMQVLRLRSPAARATSAQDDHLGVRVRGIPCPKIGTWGTRRWFVLPHPSKARMGHPFFVLDEVREEQPQIPV